MTGFCENQAGADGTTFQRMERRYIPIKDAARLIGVTPLTLRNWDKKGILTAYRNPVNNYRVYRLDQVELFLRKIENAKNEKNGRKIDISHFQV